MPSDGPFMGLASIDKRAKQFEGSMAAGTVPQWVYVCVCVCAKVLLGVCRAAGIGLVVGSLLGWLAGNFPRLNSFNNVRHIKSSWQLAKSLRASRSRGRSRSRQRKMLTKTMAKAKDERQREQNAHDTHTQTYTHWGMPRVCACLFVYASVRVCVHAWLVCVCVCVSSELPLQHIMLVKIEF